MIVEGFLHIEVERFAVSTRFFRAIKHSDAVCRLGHSSKEVLHREWTIEVYAHETHLFTLLFAEIVDGFARSFSGRTHEDNHAIGFGVTIIVEETILATCDARDFVHVFFYNFRHSLVEGVATFAVSKESFGVFSHTASHRTFRGEGAVAEIRESLLVNEGLQILSFEHFNLLDFMRSAETIEEVHERHASFDRSEVSHTSQVHHFLHRTFGQHGETSLTSRHHVLVVTEDGKSVRSNGTCRHVEHTGKEFTRNFIHIGDHQQQTLRCGERRSQCTSLQRSVHGTSGTAFTLHFLHEHSFTKHVFATLSRPIVDILSHCRRGGDGIDSRHFAKHISDVCSRLVTITSNEFLCHRAYGFILLCCLCPWEMW